MNLANMHGVDDDRRNSARVVSGCADVPAGRDGLTGIPYQPPEVLPAGSTRLPTYVGRRGSRRCFDGASRALHRVSTAHTSSSRKIAVCTGTCKSSVSVPVWM